MELQEDTQARSRAYAKIKRRCLYSDMVLTIGILCGIHFSGISISIRSGISNQFPNFYLINAAFVTVLSLLMAICLLPLSYYRSFHLEHRFGLSNQTFFLWLWDGLKAFVLNWLFSVFMIAGVYYALRNFDNTWWVLSAVFYFLVTIGISRISPTVILPLFFKIIPLGDRELEERLRALAEGAGARVLGVYKMDMSRRTKKANAFFTGLGKTKRIVLGDTMLEKYTPDEIESVLAHELGHYHKRHLWRFIAGGFVTSLAGFYLVHRTLSLVLNAAGISRIDDVAGLPAFLLILFLFLLILMPVQNAYSRRLERQADRFALERTRNTGAFISVMEKLAAQNLSEVDPHPAVEFIFYDHPSIRNRIRFAREYENRAAP